MGVSMSPLSFDAEDSTRSSAEAAFLQPALGRANLKIYAHTNAQKVLFDTNESLRAIGVSVNTAGVEYLLRANKEVIISAGVVSFVIYSSDILHVFQHNFVVQIASNSHAFWNRAFGDTHRAGYTSLIGCPGGWEEHDGK